VISALTIACVPLYTLHRHDLRSPSTRHWPSSTSSSTTNDHFEFFVFPYCDTALTRRNRRSHEEPQPPPHWKRSLQEQLIENNVLSVVCRTGRRFPSLRRG